MVINYSSPRMLIQIPILTLVSYGRSFQKYKRETWDLPITEGCVQYFDVPGPPPSCIGQEQKCREEDPAQVSGSEVLIIKSLAAHFGQGIQCSQFLFLHSVLYFGLLEMKIVILTDNT